MLRLRGFPCSVVLFSAELNLFFFQVLSCVLSTVKVHADVANIEIPQNSSTC